MYMCNFTSFLCTSLSFSVEIIMSRESVASSGGSQPEETSQGVHPSNMEVRGGGLVKGVNCKKGGP